MEDLAQLVERASKGDAVEQNYLGWRFLYGVDTERNRVTFLLDKGERKCL